jgi:hypothetical protein
MQICIEFLEFVDKFHYSRNFIRREPSSYIPKTQFRNHLQITHQRNAIHVHFIFFIRQPLHTFQP